MVAWNKYYAYNNPRNFQSGPIPSAVEATPLSVHFISKYATALENNE